MSAITVTVCGERREFPENVTLRQALESCTPYGDEAVVCSLNGEAVRSIDGGADRVLREGDVLNIYPLIIGG